MAITVTHLQKTYVFHHKVCFLVNVRCIHSILSSVLYYRYTFFFLSLSFSLLIFFFIILLLAVKFLDCAAFYFYSMRTNGERINKRSILDSIQKPQIDNIFGSLFSVFHSGAQNRVQSKTEKKSKSKRNTRFLADNLVMKGHAVRNASSGMGPGTMACLRWRRLSNME